MTAVPTPASVHQTGTGGDPDPRIVAALSRLGDRVGAQPKEQVEIFADIHRRLADVLSDPRAQA